MFTKFKEALKTTFSTKDSKQEALAKKCDACVGTTISNIPSQTLDELCAAVLDGDQRANSKTVLNTLSKHLGSQNQNSQIASLIVCNTCVRACGPIFHDELATSRFFHRVSAAVTDPEKLTDQNVLDSMLCNVEDWSRSLPQPTFSATFEAAIACGMHVPGRPEQDKAPMLVPDVYAAQLARANAVQSAVASGSTGQQHIDYEQLGNSPEDIYRPRQSAGSANAHFRDASEHSMLSQFMEGVPAIDQAVLDSMDPADRAAVLVAQYDPPPAGAQGHMQQFEAASERHPSDVAAPPPAAERSAEALPRFDPRGGTEQLLVDFTVASDNCATLKEFMKVGAEVDVLKPVAERCRALQRRVQGVIEVDAGLDEVALDGAMQVHQELLDTVAEFEAQQQQQPHPAQPASLPAAACAADNPFPQPSAPAGATALGTAAVAVGMAEPGLDLIDLDDPSAPSTSAPPPPHSPDPLSAFSDLSVSKETPSQASAIPGLGSQPDSDPFSQAQASGSPIPVRGVGGADDAIEVIDFDAPAAASGRETDSLSLL